MKKLIKGFLTIILAITISMPLMAQDEAPNDMYRDLFQNMAPPDQAANPKKSKKKLKSTNPKELEDIFLITGIIWDEENPLALILVDGIPRIFKSDSETPLGKILDIDVDKIMIQKEESTEFIYIGEKHEL